MNSLKSYRPGAAANLRSAVMDATQDPSVEATIRRGIDSVGTITIRPGDLVVIKPNLTTAKSARNSGVTTPTDIVAAIIRAVNDQQPDCRIRIVESDSDGLIGETFTKLGYRDLCQQFANVELVDLGKERTYKILMPSFSRARLIELPEILFEMNVFINVANLKRHNQERLTCVWKNIYGLPSNHLVRMKFHPFLREILFDLNMLFWPDLSVIDARVGLGGSGPLNGFPSTYNKIILSRNPLAADLTALALIGEDYRQVPSIKYGVRRWQIDPSKLEIAGDRWSPKPLAFVSPLAFKMARFSMTIRKLSIYAENLFVLAWMVGKAKGMGGFSKFASGGVQTFGSSLKLAKKVLLGLEIGEQIHG